MKRHVLPSARGDRGRSLVVSRADSSGPEEPWEGVRKTFSRTRQRRVGQQDRRMRGGPGELPEPAHTGAGSDADQPAATRYRVEDGPTPADEAAGDTRVARRRAGCVQDHSVQCLQPPGSAVSPTALPGDGGGPADGLPRPRPDGPV